MERWSRVLLVSFMLALLPLHGWSEQAPFKATVIGFDNDTMLFYFDDDAPVRSAYMGLLSFPYPDQPSGSMIRTRISEELVGKTVDVDIFGHAPDGQPRAMFFYGEDNLNSVFLVNGLAWLDFVQTKDKSFRVLQRTAQKKRIGLWAKGKPIHPRRWNKSNRMHQMLNQSMEDNKKLEALDIWSTLVVAHKKKKYYARPKCLEAAVIPWVHQMIYVRESHAIKDGYTKHPTCTNNPAFSTPKVEPQ